MVSLNAHFLLNKTLNIQQMPSPKDVRIDSYLEHTGSPYSFCIIQIYILKLLSFKLEKSIFSYSGVKTKFLKISPTFEEDNVPRY